MYCNKNKRRDRHNTKANEQIHTTSCMYTKQSSNDDNDDDDELLFTCVLVGLYVVAAAVAKGMLLKSTEAYNQFWCDG